jgi:hypothetical protein
MDAKFKLVALTLLACACGPGGLRVNSSDETSTNDSTSTSTSSSSSSSSSSSETSTSESTDPGETTDPSDTFDTLGFVPEYDEFWGSECDPFAQDCDDGEKCVPYASSGSNWDASKCVQVMGDQAVGEPCSYAGAEEGTDDCDATSMCWNVMDIDGELVGTCTPFCMGSADAPECPEGSSCNLSGDGVLTLCIFDCDPLLQDCAEGLACYWANSNFSCIFTTQDIPPGDPCGFVNDCVAGNICLDATTLPSCNGAACCSPFCNLELPDQTCDVLPGSTCVPFFEDGMAPPGDEDIGVCIVPP